jgi:uncharacterized membrane protein
MVTSPWDLPVTVMKESPLAVVVIAATGTIHVFVRLVAVLIVTWTFWPTKWRALAGEFGLSVIANVDAPEEAFVVG